MNDDIEDPEPIPPTPARVAARALVLAVLADRGLTEHERPELLSPEADLAVMVNWIEESEIKEEVEADEWEILQRPIGLLDQQSTINAIWRIEGVAVLAWALGRTELPSYDQLVAPPELFAAIDIYNTEAARELIANARLRSPEELSKYQVQALMVHWRLRDFQLRARAMDFVAFSKNCWIGSFDLSPFRIVEGDLAIGNVAIAHADADLRQACASSAMERHLAINWLHGWSECYSETDTST